MYRLFPEQSHYVRGNTFGNKYLSHCGVAESVGSGAMAIRRSHHTPQDEARDRERAPRPRIPIIPALIGTVALLNVTSVVFALID